MHVVLVMTLKTDVGLAGEVADFGTMTLERKVRQTTLAETKRVLFLQGIPQAQ